MDVLILKKMRKLSIIGLLMVIGLTGWSQTKFASKEEINRFKMSTTYVVLEENPFSIFNTTISSIMPIFWKLTPFKIINSKEFDNLKTDPQKSFLFISLAEITKTKTSLFSANTELFNNTDKHKFNLLNLSLGDRSGNVNIMPEIASIPLSYVMPDDDQSDDSDDDSDDEIDYTYKLGGILRLIQFYVTWLEENPNKSYDQLMNMYSKEVKSLEIWITKEDLSTDVSTIEKIAKVYPFKVKITSKIDIESALNSSNNNVIFVHKIGPEKLKLKDPICLITLIHCATGKPYYFSYHKVKNSTMDGMQISDFKKLSN